MNLSEAAEYKRREEVATSTSSLPLNLLNVFLRTLF